MTDWAAYPNFSRHEFECMCGRCGLASMDDEFMAALQALRTDLGFRFVITSGYRCEAYNAHRGFTQTHSSGRAADIGVSHDQARQLIAAAGAFNGLGVNQKGDRRFVHLDMLDRVAVWSY